MKKGFFITGTDTGVGKSEVAAAIAACHQRRGITVHPRKPVESGCLPNTQGETLFPQDGYTLQSASQSSDPLEVITPYRFEEAISPELAAQNAEQTVTLAHLIKACSSPPEREGILLVEGAGGFYSPIAQKALNADLATALQLPVILVAEDRLGAINQVLLTRKAILDKGLILKAIILNQLNITEVSNLHSVKQWVDEPVLSLSPQTTPFPWQTMIEPLTPLFFTQ